MEKWRENPDDAREEVGVNFHAEMPPVEAPAVPEEQAARGGMAPPDDPDGYVGPDGRARPHEQPAEVARRGEPDRGLDEREQQEAGLVDDIYE